MIYQPIAVYPDKGNNVDGLISNKFSFIASCNNVIIGYKYSIINSETYDVVYESTVIPTLKYNNEIVEIDVSPNTFVNGINYMWQITLWESLPTMFIVAGRTQEGSTPTNIVIGKRQNVKKNMYININNEQRKITSFDILTGIATVDVPFTILPIVDQQFQIYSDFIDSPHYYFKGRTTPVINIFGIDNPIMSRNINLTGTYSQNENISLKYYIFNLYYNNNIIDTTGQVYSANIKYDYNELLTSLNYTIELIVEDQEGIIVKKQIDFNVSYTVPIVNSIVDIKCLYDESALEISWNGVMQSFGKSTGQYEVNNGVLHILPNSTVFYDNLNYEQLDLKAPFLILLKTKLADKFNGKIIELENGYFVSFDGSEISYTKDGIKTVLVKFFEFEEFGLTVDGIAKPNTRYIFEDGLVWESGLWWTENNLVKIDELKIAMSDTDTQVAVKGGVEP